MNQKTRDYIKQELLTVDELAAYLGITPEVVHTRKQRGKIEGIKKGNQLLFYKGDFIRDGRVLLKRQIPKSNLKTR